MLFQQSRKIPHELVPSLSPFLGPERGESVGTSSGLIPVIGIHKLVSMVHA